MWTCTCKSFLTPSKHDCSCAFVIIKLSESVVQFDEQSGGKGIESSGSI